MDQIDRSFEGEFQPGSGDHGCYYGDWPDLDLSSGRGVYLVVAWTSASAIPLVVLASIQRMERRCTDVLTMIQQAKYAAERRLREMVSA